MIEFITKNFTKHPFKILVLISCLPVIFILDIISVLGYVCQIAGLKLADWLSCFVLKR